MSYYESLAKRSIPDPSWKYDVYLSFQGQDTGYGFTSNLYQAFKNAGIRAFLDDDEELRSSGDQITYTVVQAIEASRVSIVVLSPGYASSRWCLDELTKIIECRRTIHQNVIPVFYDVDPEDVGHQRGLYEEAFRRHMDRFSDKSDRVHTWRAALTAVANLAGFDISRNRNEENEFVRKIVERVTSTLLEGSLVLSSLKENLVGVESRMHDVIQQLNYHRPEDVVLMGLWGMGGVGKTTIARVVYEQIRHSFDRAVFFSDIREMWSRHGQIFLQEELLNRIFKEKERIKIRDIESGIAVIRGRLGLKKVLVVLDDVDNVNQLNVLCGSREWFGAGSIIIITTRNRRLLRMIGVDHVYRVKELDFNDSLKLFCRNAFNQATPSKGFARLAEDVVALCGGLPLALEVYGSFLCGRSIKEWELAMNKLTRFLKPNIYNILKISFDNLNDDTEKGIFLDIAS